MNDQYPNYRRNFVSLVGDWIFFVTGMAFISYTSVIPSFINQLTDSAPLIGLAATIPNGAWLLPQLLAANYVGSKQRKKPWVITLSLIGRPMYFLAALIMFVAGARYPWLLLPAFFLVEIVFSVADGLSVVAWFDIMSKAIPPRRRGRFYSTAQALTGLLSLAAGAVVARALGPSGPAFPVNYGLLFLSSFVLLMVSLAFFARLKEPIQQVESEREPWRAYLPRMLRLYRENRQFRLINVVRMLSGIGGLALPFYVVHATDVLGVGDASIGLFVSAQVLGGLVTSLAMGYLNERSGSKIVAQLTALQGLIIPLIALGVHYFSPPGAVAAYAYALAFFSIGGVFAGHIQGFMNFVLDIAPPTQRPAYVGLFNTLGGTVIFVAPLLGGWILQSTSYPVLFSSATLGTFISFVLSLRLVEPLRR